MSTTRDFSRVITRPRVILVALIVMSWAILSFSKTEYYSVEKGSASPLVSALTVNGVPTDAPSGKPTSSSPGFFIVDVRLEQMTLGRWLKAQVFHDVEYFPLTAIIPPGTSVGDFDRRGYLDMEQSKQTASFVALRAAGYTVATQRGGAEVNAVRKGGPAAKVKLHVGDRIVAVGGVTTMSSCDAIRALHSRPPNTTVRLSVRRAKISSSGSITRAAPADIAVTTSRPRRTYIADCAGVTDRPTSIIGVSLVDARTYVLPANVSVKTDYVGGPSGGLAMALSIYDRLTAGSLSGKHRVAVTGTISLRGHVGEIGGIGQKARAAVDAHADTFLVPSSQAGEAKAAVGSDLRIIGVSTFTEALRVLRDLGGSAEKLR